MLKERFGQLSFSPKQKKAIREFAKRPKPVYEDAPLSVEEALRISRENRDRCGYHATQGQEELRELLQGLSDRDRRFVVGAAKES